MRRPFLVLLPLLILALIVPVAIAGNTKGAKSPEIAITDGINGVTAQTTIAGQAGSPVLLVTWIPICPHCQRFMPEVHALHTKYAARGLKIITVTHGKKDYVQQFMTSRGWKFGVGFDWTGVTSQRFGISGLPGVKLIGADGHLRTYTGTLEDAIKAELPAPAPAR
jgi:cytochrome c biogenesis protein CcmG, thiol:disulfide interchange protein DsbE